MFSGESMLLDLRKLVEHDNLIEGMESRQQEAGIIAVGARVFLRDRCADDVDRFIHWQTHGEWRFLDAPWESLNDQLAPDDEAKIRQQFLESCKEEPPALRKRAMIVAEDARPIGFVNRYPHERFPGLFLVGMRICEDDFLSRGYGTEALQLWIDYLFDKSTVHRIGAATWSFNPRAIALLKKLGFTHEGTERELASWQGRWQSRLYFGMLRHEWELKRHTSS
jgi:RimJ/RimL family protein N-acetyltransferase